jgi:hypothetical protein
MQRLLRVLFCTGAMTMAQGATEIALRPGQAAVDLGKVPRLWDAVADADRVRPLLTLAPEAACQWVLAPGETMRVQLQAPAAAGGTRAVLTVWDWQRNPVSQAGWALPVDEWVALTVTGRGVYLLTLDLFDGDTCLARLPRSFAVLPSNEDKRETWRQGEFWVGVCCFPGRQHWRNDFGPGHPPQLTEEQTREMDAELSRRLGVTVARPDIAAVWPAADQPIDFARADAAIAAWTSRGFALDLQLWNPGADWSVLPKYAAVTDPKWRYPAREEALRTFVGACLDRWGRHAKLVELGNETDNPDFWRGTPEEYLRWCEVVTEEVRRRLPDIPIANGGYTFMLPEWSGQYIRALRETTQIQAYHAHGGVDLAKQQLTTLRTGLAAAAVARPRVVNTEMGFCAWRLDMERHMAATAVQKLLYCWAHGNEGALLYCSREYTGPRLTANDWGYLDYFLCPRFMYGAVGAFIDHLAGARFERIAAETDGLYAYVFATPDARVLALFAPNDQEREVTVESDGKAALSVDPMGNETPVENAALVRVKAGLYPTLVRCAGATTISVK